MQFHPQFLIDSQFTTMSTQQVFINHGEMDIPMHRGFPTRRYTSSQHMSTRKRTPPTLQCCDSSVLPIWQTVNTLLQEPNTIYIGSKKYAPALSAPSKWDCDRLTHPLHMGGITLADYRRLYEEFVRQWLWNNLDELEGKRLVFSKEDMNKCNGPILLKLFVERFEPHIH